jgi:soluble lytic murein transglycosylase
MGPLLPVVLATTLPLAAAATPRAVTATLSQGHQAFQAGDYRKAARLLDGLAARSPRTRDHVLYLAAESAFYAGQVARARSLFAQLGGDRDSRFAPVAAWRTADCLWAEGRRDEAATVYRKLLAGTVPPGVDRVVARFRLAELATATTEADALFHQIHVEHPAHPLSAEAARRVRGPVPADNPAPAAAPAAPDARARLRRASLLADKKLLAEAQAELLAITDTTPEIQIERDLQLGMVKFRTRREYPAAAALLLAVAPRLTGDRAPFAAFHGARALLRAGRDEEAVAAKLKVVERYPGSRWAVEAQFVAGWIEFNRGRYRECIPLLRTTLEKNGRSRFARDAAWYLALANHFLDRPDDALAALADYARLSGRDADAARRAAYWRGRFLAAKGNKRDAHETWQELLRREPLSYYGLLARARLQKAGVKAGVDLPRGERGLPPPSRKAQNDPAVVRADELARAGLAADAGPDLQRREDELDGRVGRDQALAVLLDRYRRYGSYRRACQLAESRGGATLQAAPVKTTRAVWEAAHPRAYQDLVERHAKKAGAPPLFVYSIMYKESGFAPHVTSPADARGLLQLLPELGAELSARTRTRFFADDLYRPEVNVRLGAMRLGELARMFRGQLFLVAGAYNGGIRAVTRWLDRHGTRPLDEFVELVGFKESREYIKRVSAIHARYQYLYTGKPPALPLTVNPRYLKEKARPAAPAPPPPPPATPATDEGEEGDTE